MVRTTRGPGCCTSSPCTRRLRGPAGKSVTSGGPTVRTRGQRDPNPHPTAYPGRQDQSPRDSVHADVRGHPQDTGFRRTPVRTPQPRRQLAPQGEQDRAPRTRITFTTSPPSTFISCLRFCCSRLVLERHFSSPRRSTGDREGASASVWPPPRARPHVESVPGPAAHSFQAPTPDAQGGRIQRFRLRVLCNHVHVGALKMGPGA